MPWSYESSFIHAFGPRLHSMVTEEFAARGIDGHTGEVVADITPLDRCRVTPRSTRPATQAESMSALGPSKDESLYRVATVGVDDGV